MVTVKIRNMEEFSAASGISRPTVSKYFNDPGSVRKSTRAKIEQALAEFDYHPNMFAMNVNRRNPRNIGIIVPYIVDPFFAEVVRQIELRCLQAGYWAIVLSSHGESSLEANALDTLRSMKISGAILRPVRRGFRPAPNRAAERRGAGRVSRQPHKRRVPFRRNGQRPEHRSYRRLPLPIGRAPVLPGDAAREPERHRAEGRLSGDDEAPRVRARGHIRGRRRRMELRGDGLQRAIRLLGGSGFPTRTVLCANDRLSIGVLAAAYSQGVKVGIQPGCELRVAGHDDHPLSRFTCPALTTVAQDYQRLAARSLEMLFELIEGGKAAGSRPEHCLLEARLMMRASA